MNRRTRSAWATALCFVMAHAFISACTPDPISKVREPGTCASNRDCSGTSVCVAGVCRAPAVRGCATDENCPLGQICDTARGACVDPEVVPSPDARGCREDAECSKEERCDRATQRCVPGRRACNGPRACAQIDQLCDTSRGECVECLTASDCTMPAKCSEGACVEDTSPTGCNDDRGCQPPMTVCASGACVRGCQSPIGALACGPGTTCNPMSGHCEGANACGSDATCGAPARVCEGGSCLPGCGELGGIACAGGEVCNPPTGRCTPNANTCASDPQCGAPASVCDGGRCVAGCARSGASPCSATTRCNPQSGRCEANASYCQTDRDCRSPDEICNLTRGDCEPGCGTTGCDAGSMCEATTGRCTGIRMCSTDAFEENDTSATAAMIVPGAIQALFACPSDEDWYAIALQAGDTLSVETSFSVGEGNIDVEVLGPDGDALASGRGQTAREAVSATARTSGTHKIRVFLAADAGPMPGAAYAMTVAVTPAPCGMDPYEDNDSRTTPSPIVAGTVIGVNVCTSDDDFYSLNLRTGDRVVVSASFTHAEGDIDIELLNPSGTRVAGSSGTADEESLEYTANMDGAYVARVLLYRDAGTRPGNTYALDVGVTAAPPPPMSTCTPDWMEENDGLKAAPTVFVGTLAGLTICPGDDDFYSITLETNDRVSVQLTFPTTEVNMDVEILGPSGAVRQRTTGNASPESITYTATAAGRYGIHPVLTADPGTAPGGTYDLVLSVTSGSGCRVDAWEPNDSLAEAPVAPFRQLPPLAICSDDPDYFAVDLVAGDRFVASAAFANDEGDLDMILLDAAGAEVARSAGITDSERITFTPRTAGRYTLQVVLYQDSGSSPGNAYSLTLSR